MCIRDRKNREQVIGYFQQLKSKRLINHHCLPQGLIITFNEGRLNQKDFSYKAKRYAKLKQIKEDRLTAMLGYINTDGCLNEYLLGYFNEDHPNQCELCNHCARIDDKPLSKRDLEMMSQAQLTQTLVKAIDNKNHALLSILQSMSTEGIINLDIQSVLADEGL